LDRESGARGDDSNSTLGRAQLQRADDRLLLSDHLIISYSNHLFPSSEKGETSGMELRLPEAPAPAIPDSNQTKADSKASSSIPRVYDMRSTDTAATRARNMFAFKETFVPEDDEEEEEQDGDRKDNGKGKGKERNIDGSMLRRKGKRE